jgi:hypothetical protein
MQMLWCWRCKCEVPMLDEVEYAEVSQLYSGGIRATKEFRERWGVQLKDPLTEERFQPVRDACERLTGIKESNENAIMHHRLALHGPPCKHCGKPLRTPKAKLYASCMRPVD